MGSLSFWFIDKFEGNINSCVPIKPGSTVILLASIRGGGDAPKVLYLQVFPVSFRWCWTDYNLKMAASGLDAALAWRYLTLHVQPELLTTAQSMTSVHLDKTSHGVSHSIPALIAIL